MKIREIITATVLILALITISTTTAAALSCTCGDICANETGWWHGGGALNASGTPIQAAVGNATAGDTICVAAGSYTENVDITKQLTLTGEGAGVVTVTANSSSDHVFEVTADYVNISGFTATGTTSYPYAAGIYLGSADHCNISENNCSNNHCGIHLHHSSGNTLASNTANSNNGNGIYLYSSSGNTFTSNTANSNSGNGIYLQCKSSSNTLTSNTANSNGASGIHLQDTSSNYNTLTSNTANSNGASGIHLDKSSNYNTLTSNTANSNNDCGIHLSHSGGNTLASNNCSNNIQWDIYIQSSYSTFTDNTLNGTTVSFTYGGDVSLKGVGSPAADPAGQQTIGKFISATNQSAGAWLFLNFSYSDADVSGLDESNLAVWKHNGTTWLKDGWNGTRYLDTAGNVVGVNITSFSVFAPAVPIAETPIVSYGKSVYARRNVRFAWRALGEPDEKGALMLRNARITIELDEMIIECEKVSVSVRRAALRTPSFDVAVSSDGATWTQIGSASCSSSAWTRYDFTGDWSDVKYIGIRKPGTRWKPKMMGLDAVCAEGSS